MSNKYTQEQVAEKIGSSCKFISMIERGVSGLSVSTIANLCDVLDIEPNSLFNGIIDFHNNDVSNKYIIDSLSLLSSDDKDFIISVIDYVLKKNS